MKKIGFWHLAFGVWLLAFSSCSQKTAVAPIEERPENREAKAMLQGVWLESEYEEVTFRAEGDTIFYPDSTSVPAYFKIVDDTLILGRQHYHIEQQTAHLFVFKNQMGDVVKLVKSDNPEDAMVFTHDVPQVLSVTEVVKRDSVVYYDGERYHWYIAVNPTKYKVSKTAYNDEGVGVENVYYDNIIHISLFQGNRQLFSKDFTKKMFAQMVPEAFLEQAILGNMQYVNVDAKGFHFYATLCIPDGASCYMVSNDITIGGELSMSVVK